MKNLMNLSIALLVLTFLTTTMLAQSNPNGKGLNGKNIQSQWVDSNGDGICDNFGTDKQGSKNAVNGKMGKSGRRMGDGTGSGNGFGDGSGVRPQDGTGFGRKNGDGTGTGNCDGSGPKGNGKRGNK
ncbi:MAG: hypothetical protein L3J41_05595 [Melioribacteraceae bacterium]|nr:hypothetical protein [Melioribacteraceae bacterium]